MAKNDVPKWLLWIFGGIFIFAILMYIFLGPVQQMAVFTGEVNLEEKSVKAQVVSDNDKIIYAAIYSFFGMIIILALIWAGVKIYEIKHK